MRMKVSIIIIFIIFITIIIILSPSIIIIAKIIIIIKSTYGICFILQSTKFIVMRNVYEEWYS